MKEEKPYNIGKFCKALDVRPKLIFKTALVVLFEDFDTQSQALEALVHLFSKCNQLSLYGMRCKMSTMPQELRGISSRIERLKIQDCQLDLPAFDSKQIVSPISLEFSGFNSRTTIEKFFNCKNIERLTLNLAYKEFLNHYGK